MRALDNRIPPPVVAAVVAVAMWSMSSLQPALPFAPWVRHVLAIVLALAGISFDLLGLLAFRKSRTTANPLKPHKTSALVTGGVYGITRNPMYVGLALLLVAWAVQLSSIWSFIGPVLLVLYIDRFQIRPEERILASIFAEEFPAYAARVRRWL